MPLNPEEHKAVCEQIMKELQDKVKPVGYFTPEPVAAPEPVLPEFVGHESAFMPFCASKPGKRMPFTISVPITHRILTHKNVTINPANYLSRLRYRYLCYAKLMGMKPLKACMKVAGEMLSGKA